MVNKTVMCYNTYMSKCKHTSIRLPPDLIVEVKILCVLTGKTMGDFIRIALQDKVRELKETKVSQPIDKEVGRAEFLEKDSDRLRRKACSGEQVPRMED